MTLNITNRVSLFKIKKTNIAILIQKLNNHQLKAGGLELRTEDPDTGQRPVEFSPQF